MIVEWFDAVVIKTPRGIARIRCIRGNPVWTSNDAMFAAELNDLFGTDSGLVTFGETVFGKTVVSLAKRAIDNYGGEIINTKTHTVEIPDDIII